MLLYLVGNETINACLVSKQENYKSLWRQGNYQACVVVRQEDYKACVVSNEGVWSW